jgi:hypothetical protein
MPVAEIEYTRRCRTRSMIWKKGSFKKQISTSAAHPKGREAKRKPGESAMVVDNKLNPTFADI